MQKGTVRAATIRDVAARAGVSRTSVSLAMRNDPSIPAVTRERILAAAEAMDYRPNPLVKALMAQIGGRRPEMEKPGIAVLDYFGGELGLREFPLFVEMLEGATARTQKLGFTFELLRGDFYTGRDHEFHDGKTERLEKNLRSEGVRGILVPPLPSRGRIPFSSWEHFCAVSVGYDLATPAVHRVMPDYFQNCLTLMEQLLERGLIHIGFAALEDVAPAQVWLGAYHSVCERQRMRPATFIYRERYADYPALLHWAEREKLDVIIGHDHEFYSYLGQHRTPGLAALGYADLAWNSDPRNRDIAGVDQRMFNVGAAAIDILVAHLHRNEYGLPRVQKTTMISGEWREGKSVPSKA